MSYHYLDTERAGDPHYLPSIETFYIDIGSLPEDCPACIEDSEDIEHVRDHAGWYWWSCLPGCMPDGEAKGPFESEADALADAREGFDDDDGSEERPYLTD